jgi:hypothetical protein
MKKEFLKIYNLPQNQLYRVESLGATTREYRTQSYNLRGMNDGILYRRVVGTKALLANVSKYGIGITIELLEMSYINGYKVVNLRTVEIAPQQISLF